MLVTWVKSLEGGEEEVLLAWMKSWGAGGGASGTDEELGGREEVLVARMKSWGARGGACGMDEELGGERRCWWHG